MNNMFFSLRRMNRIYQLPDSNIYTARFLQDLSSGYSFILGDKTKSGDFLTFEPQDSKISKLFKRSYRYDLSHDVEEIIEKITYGLIAFGKAYAYLEPDYHLSKDEKSDNRELSSLKIRNIEGFIKQQNKTHILFYRKGLNNKVSIMRMNKKQLIVFDIKELGYKKRQFINILRKLEKCDITLSSTYLVGGGLDGYDFSIHAKNSMLHEMKAVKDIGWSFRVEGLSDSYLLYKRIQFMKLKLKFLQYIVERLNTGLEEYIEDVDGKLVAHIKEIRLDKLWTDYYHGKVSGTELTSILYHSVI